MMTENVLEEKLKRAVARYDYECPHIIASAVMDVLEEHFRIDRLDLEAGEVVLTSDNTTLNTELKVGGTPLPVMFMRWELDAEDSHGKLYLTFM